MNTREAIEWTEEMVNLLRQNYQIETNEQLAQRFGISTRTLRRKAKMLGLTKSEPVTKTKQIEELAGVLSEGWPIRWVLAVLQRKKAVCAPEYAPIS